MAFYWLTFSGKSPGWVLFTPFHNPFQASNLAKILKQKTALKLRRSWNILRLIRYASECWQITDTSPGNQLGEVLVLGKILPSAKKMEKIIMVDTNIDIDNFLASHTYSQETKRTYRDIIPRVLDVNTEIETLTATGLLEMIEKQNWGNARQCLGLAATQKYLNWKYGDAHPALSAKIKRQKGSPQRSLDKNVALKLLASFNPYRGTGARDLAIASLFIDTGLRVSEICRLQIRYIDFVDLYLQVLIKGGKWDYAIFSSQTAVHIQHWLNYRKSIPDEDWLFTSTFTGEKLTPNGLASIVRSWGIRIGIKLSPHDLRRTFATLSTEAGAPERVLMAGGRWASSSMILKYTQSLRLRTMRKYLPIPKILE